MYLTYKQILVCLAIIRLGSNARSVNIANLIVELTGRHETTHRGIYSMVDRLRKKKYIVTKHEEAGRVHYLTASGNKILSLCLQEIGLIREEKSRRKRA